MPHVTYGEAKHACPSAGYLMLGKSDPEYRAFCRCPRPTLEALERDQRAALERAMRRTFTEGH